MKRIAGLLAALAALIAPSVAQAWDVAAQVKADCNYITITLTKVNPSSADYAIVIDRNGAAERIPGHYSPGNMTAILPSGAPQNGSTTKITVHLIDHDSLGRSTPRAQDVTSYGPFYVTCGSPPAPPAPPVTPPSPPVPPKVCVPSGGSVDLHKTGSRSFELIGRVHRIRWRFTGERFPSLNGQKSVTIPGEGTGRVVVRFRANCQSGKRVGQVLPAPPPATAGRVHMASAPANTPPEVTAAAQKVADQWLRDWNANLSNAPATKSRVRWCRVNLYRTEAPEWWNCRLRLKLSNGGHCSARTRVERFGDGTASPGPYKIRRCVL